MRGRKHCLSAVTFGLSLSGCAILPDLPVDYALPIQEILLHTACELQDAFRYLSQERYSRFKADQWLISITLTPKVDTNLNVGFGHTRKTSIPNALRTHTWFIGAAPGVQLDGKGQKSGAITYSIKSQNLIADNTLICDPAQSSYHVLARNLGVGEWLYRAAVGMDAAQVADVDKPTFSADVTIKFGGNGSYTFAFPAGSDLGTLGGSYQLDEQLQILMTRLTPTKKFIVISLPTAQDFGPDPRAVVLTQAETSVVQDAKARLDVIQLEQTIRGLRAQ